MPWQAAEPPLEAQPGDQQGAAVARRCRKSLQGDHQPQAQRDSGAGAKLR